MGKHRGGEIVDVHVLHRLLEIWSGNDLIKTVARTTQGGVRKKRASKPAESMSLMCQASTETQPSSIRRN